MQQTASGKTVLVVDDEPLNRKLIRTILARDHVTVIEAADGEEGIRLARSRSPELILMDIRLPGMDGLEATRVLKEDAATAGIPILILSAGSVAEDEGPLRETGCAGLILKPFRAAEFLEAVRPYLT